MCGIGGISAKGTEAVPEKALQRMSQALAHRGPDDSGIYLSPDRNIGLVHRRLSIIDLSRNASQPMADVSGKKHLTYNGEIYNYRELRNLLFSKYSFHTQSDTETILALYADQGALLVEKLRGMFAFGLWDEEKQTLFLTRDRMGIKPLYYAETDRFFLFASEVRALLATDLLKKELNLTAFSGYLSFGSVPSPYTMFQAIRSLPPAGWLAYRRGKCEIRTYWDFPASLHRAPSARHYSFAPVPSASGRTPRSLLNGNTEAWTLERLREKLQDAVKSHFVSDVPVGIFLSGGVDSTAVTGLAREVTAGKLQTFSITFPDSLLDESTFARLAAEKFETEHREAPVEAKNFLEALPDIFSAMDQPTIDGVNTFFVSKLAQEYEIKVVLSGLGGDELFAGYPSFRILPKLCFLNSILQRFPGGKLTAKTFLGLLPQTHRLQSLLEFLESPGTPEAGYFAVRKLFLESEKEKLLSPLFQLEEKLQPIQYLAEIAQSGTIPGSPAEYAGKLEMRGYLHNQLLRDADMMGMAHGIEIRVPFLDPCLVEYVSSIPMEKKMTRRPKDLLLTALPEKIPAEIFRRPKMGFTFPFEAWFRKEFRSTLNSFFQEGPSRATQHFWNWPNVKHVWEDFLENRLHWSRPWSLYVLENWLRIQFS